MRATSLDKHFDVFMVSDETGMMKLDPEIFNLFVDHLGIKLSELTFIDDSRQSLSTSKSCGFEPLLFESYEKLLKDLEYLGIL